MSNDSNNKNVFDQILVKTMTPTEGWDSTNLFEQALETIIKPNCEDRTALFPETVDGESKKNTYFDIRNVYVQNGTGVCVCDMNEEVLIIDAADKRILHFGLRAFGEDTYWDHEAGQFGNVLEDDYFDDMPYYGDVIKAMTAIVNQPAVS